MAPAGFGDVLIDGLAPDGGLVVPDAVPVLTDRELTDLASAPYPEVAAEVLTRFAPDLGATDLVGASAAAYGPDRFDHPDVVSLRPLGDGLVLCGLSHGPTLAFKDMAMQLLAELFDRVLTPGERSPCWGRPRRHRVERRARLPGQRQGRRVHAVAARQDEPVPGCPDVRRRRPQHPQPGGAGVFDQCQDLVKQVTADAAFKAEHRIGAVNSINWARVVAQVAYYLYASLRVAAAGGEVFFAVPTGNFGNVYAGHVARRMGAPIRRLVVATNENDVLAEFFATGRYRVRRPEDVHATSSPSMDIARASNFERYVYDLVGGEAGRVADLFGRPAGSTSGTSPRRWPPPGSPQTAPPTPTASPPSVTSTGVGASSSTRTPPTASPWGGASSKKGCR